MNILITQSVTAAAEIFQDVGQLQFIPDSDLEHADLTDIDAVIMRSQSRVTVEQVQGTKVKFIGSATAGLDHLPVDALRALGIQVVNAPGCNANSVADYWLSAMCVVSMPPSDRADLLVAGSEACRGTLRGCPDSGVTMPQHRERTAVLGQPFHGKTLGIVGYGEVGQRVAKRAAALGLKVIVNDPPRFAQPLSTASDAPNTDLPVGATTGCQDQAGTKSVATSIQCAAIPYSIVSLTTLFEQADIVSLHVPLITTGPWPTVNLVDAALLAKLKPGATFINTARGEVCDANALVDAKTQGLIKDLMIDVWPHEPDIDVNLWQAATIATPHIAGHSYMAKWQGTWQVYEALMQTSSPLPLAGEGLGERVLVANTPSPGASHHPLPQAGEEHHCYDALEGEEYHFTSELAGLWHYVQQVYDVTHDHRQMHAWLTLPAPERIKAFSHYRRNYPMRSELCTATVARASLTPWQREVLLSAGVTLKV